MMRKKVVLRYTVCYFSVIFFVFLFGLLVVRTLLLQYKQEITASVQKQQEEIIDTLERDIADQALLANEIYVDAYTNPVELQMDPLNEQRGIRQLHSYQRTLELNDVLFLYYTGGAFYTPMGKTSLPVFSGMTLSLNAESTEILMQKSSNPQGYSCTVLTAISGEKVFLFIYPVPQAQNPAQGVVGFMIRESTIEQMLEKEIHSYNYFAVMDFNGALFAQTDNTTSLSETERAQMVQKMLRYESIEQHGYVAIECPSSQYGFSLHIGISTQQIWSKVNQLEWWLLVCSVLFFAVISAILFLINWFNTRPILRLQKFALEKSGVSQTEFKENNEIAVIQNILGIAIEDQHKKGEKIQEFTQMVKQHMAFILASGMISQPEMLQSMLNAYHIDFDFPYYAVLGVEARKSIPPELIRTIGTVEQFKICCISTDNNHCLVIVVGLHDMDYLAKIRIGIAREINALFAQNKMSILLTGWGMVYPSLEKIHDSYREMLSVLRVSALNAENEGNAPILLFDRTAKFTRNEYIFSTEELERFRISIQDNNFDTAESAFAGLMSKYYQLDTQNDDLRRFHRYSIVSILMSELDVNPKQIQRFVDMPSMKDADFESEIHTCLKGSLVSNSKKHPEICEILQYIQGHYADPNLSQLSISSYFGMTQSNFSKFIKNHTGKNYSEYINDLRMEEASSLLTNSQDSVAQIVALVGYLDSSAFTRKFKLRYGQTPTQYRELHQKIHPVPETTAD